MNDKIKGILVTLLLPFSVYAMFIILAPGRFGNVRVLRTILIQSLIPLLGAYGMIFGRSMKMLDLSIGSRMIAASMAGGVFAAATKTGILGMVLMTLAVSFLLGAICGLVFRYCRIPSIVVSLVMAMIFEVIGSQITGGRGFLELPSQLTLLGKIPYNLILVLLTTLVFSFIYYRTRFCYHVKAISGDELIAKGNGIDVERAKFLAYVAGSFFIGLAAVIQISYATSMSAKLSMESLSMSFRPLMAMIIGMQLQDYIGLPAGMFAGAFMISTLFSGLVALGLPAPAQDIALGLFLIVIVSISTNTDELAMWVRKRRGMARA